MSCTYLYINFTQRVQDKYFDCGISYFIDQDVALLTNLNEFPTARKVIETQINLIKKVHAIYSQIKGSKKLIAQHKETIVNAIENTKEHIPVKEAIKIFNISRATYQNYKTLVLNKCSASIFEWCVKKYPNQLIKAEIEKINHYFQNSDYQYWSKASLYYLGVRNKDFSFCIATFYKYTELLGYKNKRHIHKKQIYKPLKSYRPNEIWCADVTIYKTTDGVKHYIHFLIDHYSKMVLGYQIANSPNPKVIKSLLQNAFESQHIKKPLQFVTDGGIENVNKTVQNYLLSTGSRIIHSIAQKDIPQSNSLIEAFNKVLKNQFLHPENPENGNQLEVALAYFIPVYCNIRPQHSLQGNTPIETYHGKPITFSQYKAHFNTQKALRKTQNHLNRCKKCLN